MRKIMFRRDRFVTIPVSDSAQAELSEFVADHLDELATRLEPHGLDPRDIAIPRFRQCLFEDEA